MTDHSVNFEAVEDRTGTKYNIQFIAEHPLKIGTGAPEANKILLEIEMALGQPGIGLVPIAAQVERMDNAWGTFESEGWLKRMPEALLIAVAKMFEGELAQKMDPESDKWDPKFCTGEPWVEIVELAEDIVKQRREVNRT